MSGTATNYSTTVTAIGPGRLYAGLSIPGTGESLLLDSDGTPDATQNPDAIHLGYTEAGAEWKLSHTLTEFTGDQSNSPIYSRITNEAAMLSGSLYQVLDFDIATILSPVSTRSDLSGTEGMSFGGQESFNYHSVAVIFPVEGSGGTAFGVFHLYRAVNDQGLAAKITSRSIGASPFAFVGHAILSRAEGDMVGRAYQQTGALMSESGSLILTDTAGEEITVDYA